MDARVAWTYISMCAPCHIAMVQSKYLTCLGQSMVVQCILHAFARHQQVKPSLHHTVNWWQTILCFRIVAK